MLRIGLLLLLVPLSAVSQMSDKTGNDIETCEALVLERLPQLPYTHLQVTGCGDGQVAMDSGSFDDAQIYAGAYLSILEDMPDFSGSSMDSQSISDELRSAITFSTLVQLNIWTFAELRPRACMPDLSQPENLFSIEKELAEKVTRADRADRMMAEYSADDPDTVAGKLVWQMVVHEYSCVFE